MMFRSALSALALGLLSTTASTGPAAAQAATQAAAAAPATAVETEAIQAVQRMRAFLGTLTTFEVRSETTQDLVLDTGQKVQLDGVVTYKVRRPNGFQIKVETRGKVRDFLYDGKTLTVYAPTLRFYAQAPAPATIGQTLDDASNRYGIDFPLEDLFRWSEPGDDTPKVTMAMVVGDATIDGADTTQYLLRQGDVDWQIWIEKGDKPLPRKIVITDRTDDSQPAYSVRLSWNLNAPINDATFAFRPAKDDKPIKLTAR